VLNKIFSVIVLCALSSSLAFANSIVPKFVQTNELRLNQDVLELWTPRANGMAALPCIGFDLNDSGEILNAFVVKSSGVYQIDADCLEAVCSLSPTPIGNSHGYISHMEIDFTKLQKLEDLKKSQPLRQFKNLANGVVFIHRIPLPVLKRYPGIFTEPELLDSSNLCQISVKPIVGRPYWTTQIQNHLQAWSDFYRLHEHSDRSEILDYSRKQLR
jgi:hypothetical protein